MTEKQTLSIDQTEWRVLFAANIQRVVEFINAQAVNSMLTAEHLKLMHDHLDRAKLLATAWHRASPPAEAQGNGAEPVMPKRRGRPPKAAQAQVVQ